MFGTSFRGTCSHAAKARSANQAFRRSADGTISTVEELLESNEVEGKFKRVKAFLDYLKVEEERELYVVMNTSDSLALRRAFIPRMISEFGEDELYIRRKIKRRRTFKGEKTPYITEAEEIEEGSVVITENETIE
jgi:hypothetical protein